MEISLQKCLNKYNLRENTQRRKSIRQDRASGPLKNTNIC